MDNGTRWWSGGNENNREAQSVVTLCQQGRNRDVGHGARWRWGLVQQRGVVGRYNKYDIDKAETETDGVGVAMRAAGRSLQYDVDKPIR